MCDRYTFTTPAIVEVYLKSTCMLYVKCTVRVHLLCTSAPSGKGLNDVFVALGSSMLLQFCPELAIICYESGIRLIPRHIAAPKANVIVVYIVIARLLQHMFSQVAIYDWLIMSKWCTFGAVQNFKLLLSKKKNIFDPQILTLNATFIFDGNQLFQLVAS